MAVTARLSSRTLFATHSRATVPIRSASLLVRIVVPVRLYIQPSESMPPGSSTSKMRGGVRSVARRDTRCDRNGPPGRVLTIYETVVSRRDNRVVLVRDEVGSGSHANSPSGARDAAGVSGTGCPWTPPPQTHYPETRTAEEESGIRPPRQ